MNAALREKNRQAVRPWRDFVWLLLHALRKLPPSRARVVYRAMPGVVLAEGAELQWSAFSSTATKVDVMKAFLPETTAPGWFFASNTASNTGPRTMVHLELTEPVGRDVSAFSLYPQECEALLPPNVCFKVVSRYNDGSGLNIVQCTQTSPNTLLDFAARSTQRMEVGWGESLAGWGESLAGWGESLAGWGESLAGWGASLGGWQAALLTVTLCKCKGTSNLTAMLAGAAVPTLLATMKDPRPPRSPRPSPPPPPPRRQRSGGGGGGGGAFFAFFVPSSSARWRCSFGGARKKEKKRPRNSDTCEYCTHTIGTIHSGIRRL